LGYDARRPVDHPTPFEPTECFNLTRKGSSFRDVKNTGCNFAARVSNLLTIIRKDALTAQCSEGA
ncbi:hypothetical protein ACCT03_02550, partial [Rhizobium johnstonii]